MFLPWLLPQFSIILQQLFESYNSMVSTGNSEELCRTVLAWFEQNCTLPSLRPGERILCPIHHTYSRWCHSSCLLAPFPSCSCDEQPTWAEHEDLNPYRPLSSSPPARSVCQARHAEKAYTEPPSSCVNELLDLLVHYTVTVLGCCFFYNWRSMNLTHHIWY